MKRWLAVLLAWMICLSSLSVSVEAAAVKPLTGVTRNGYVIRRGGGEESSDEEEEQDTEDPSEDSWISWTALGGEPLPLDPSAYIFDGVEDYVGKAIVIAVNQAYEQFLAGQQ